MRTKGARGRSHRVDITPVRRPPVEEAGGGPAAMIYAFLNLRTSEEGRVGTVAAPRPIQRSGGINQRPPPTGPTPRRSGATPRRFGPGAETDTGTSVDSRNSGGSRTRVACSKS